MKADKRLTELEKRAKPETKIIVFVCHCDTPGENCTCEDRPKLEPGDQVIYVRPKGGNHE